MIILVEHNSDHRCYKIKDVCTSIDRETSVREEREYRALMIMIMDDDDDDGV